MKSLHELNMELADKVETMAMKEDGKGIVAAYEEILTELSKRAGIVFNPITPFSAPALLLVMRNYVEFLEQDPGTVAIADMLKSHARGMFVKLPWSGKGGEDAAINEGS